ncbi:MAG: HWE histidine kinase domain-containing protein [Mesorhizobium sp.]
MPQAEKADPTASLNQELKAADPALIGNDALLAAVFSGSGDCVKILDLDGRLQFMSDGGKRVMEVENFSAIKGCPWPDFWVDEGNLAAREAVEDARNGKTAHFVGSADTAKGNARYWDVQVMPILGPDGKPTHILSISRDMSEIRLAELALRESELRLKLALAAAQMGVWETHVVDGEFVSLRRDDRANLLLGGMPGEAPTFEGFASSVHPDDRYLLQPAADRALADDGDGVLDVEYRILAHDDQPERWVHARAQAIPMGNGTRFIGTVRDISERKEAEARQRILSGELQHRIKNSLAIVSAIASQTFKGDDVAERKKAFTSRLEALAQAHDILTAAAWKGAPIRTVINSALGPHRSAHEVFEIDGPDLELSAKQALSMGLALHELATNAVKYGALSQASGRVRIAWSLGRPDQTGGQEFTFTWHEIGGPSVAAPTASGFGSRVIKSVFAADFEGTVHLDYAPDGLVCMLIARLAPQGDGS